MNANRAILAGIAALAIAGLLLLAMSGGNTGPDMAEIERRTLTEPIEPIEPIEVQERQRPSPTVRPTIEKQRAPDGQAYKETLLKLRTEGLPQRPVEGGPLDPDSWERRRREADDRWHEDMMKHTEQWAEAQNLSSDLGNEVVAQVARFSKRVVTVRDDVRQGRIAPEDARDNLEKLRYSVTEETYGLLGEENAEALNAYLSSTTTGGGW